MRPERPVVHTRVGRALMGDNHFRGRSVARELLGVPLSSLYSIAIGGPELSAQQSRIIDTLIAASMASDPRIWPLKVSPLVASYGSTFSGYAAAMSYFEHNMVSPMQSDLASFALLEIQEREAAGEDLRDILDAWPGHVPGFGVPARAYDERAHTFAQWYEANVPEEDRPTWSLVRRIQALSPKYNPNIIAATAAVCIDLGLEPHQAGLISGAYANICALATASESSQEPDSPLKLIPECFVDYLGPENAVSPRATSRT